MLKADIYLPSPGINHLCEKPSFFWWGLELDNKIWALDLSALFLQPLYKQM